MQVICKCINVTCCVFIKYFELIVIYVGLKYYYSILVIEKNDNIGLSSLQIFHTLLILTMNAILFQLSF